MKIKFWGTAAGLAEANRYCTSVLIEISGEYYILDFGAPVEYLIKKENIPVSKIKAAFVTHMHADHVASLTCFSKLYAKFTDFLYPDAHTELYLPDGIEVFHSWLDMISLDMSERMEIKKINEGEIYHSDTVRVRAIRTEHLSRLGLDKPSYAFVMECEGKKVLFTGDLTEDLHDFPRGEQYDLAVCELGHGNVADIKRCITEANCKQTVFYHMSSDEELVRKLGINRIEMMQNEAENLGVICQFAYDGMEVEL